MDIVKPTSTLNLNPKITIGGHPQVLSEKILYKDNEMMICPFMSVGGGIVPCSIKCSKLKFQIARIGGDHVQHQKEQPQAVLTCGTPTIYNLEI